MSGPEVDTIIFENRNMKKGHNRKWKMSESSSTFKQPQRKTGVNYEVGILKKDVRACPKESW